MQEMIAFIAQTLVDHPEHVSVEKCQTEDQVIYKLYVAADDIGKVIGKEGRIAKAIRTITVAASQGEKRRIRVEVYSSETREDVQ